MERAEAPIRLERVNHYYGAGALRKQILHDVSVELRAGEIVIVTGPSGSGKTTMLTLIGALRSAQEGSVRVLGAELRGAGARTLERVRRDIGYIFQAHNLLDALTATQNVMLSLLLDRVGTREARKRAREWLEAVGLGERADQHALLLHAAGEPALAQRTTEPDDSPTMSGEPQARSTPPHVVTRTMPLTATVNSVAPRRSIRTWRFVSEAGSTVLVTARASAPSGRLMRKAQRQVSWSVKKPPSSGPTMLQAPKRAPNQPW